MKKFVLIALCALLILPVIAYADQIKQVERLDGIPSFLGFKPDEFIVVMKADVGRLNIVQRAGAATHIGDPEFDRLSDRFAVSGIEQQFKGAELRPEAAELAKYHKVRFSTGTLEDALEAYRALPMVESVEPIGIHSLHEVPNDFYFDPHQWYHQQTSDDDIDSPEGWDIETGSPNIIVAILDSGTRYYHPDLGGVNGSPSNPGASRGNMWINNAELNGSAGVDDDGNGFTDDWIGWDFLSSASNCWPGEDCSVADNDPRDFNGHGTHTSGIVGMITNDGYGMAGVAGGWNSGAQTEYGNGCKVMALRIGHSYNYLGQEVGVVYMDFAAEAFYYAADNGAKIASCSWGSSNSGGLGGAIDYFLNNGGLIFKSAGNAGNQVTDYMTARTDIISVAATNEADNGASFTSYGTWVDISAPGDNIYSTYHDHLDPNTNYWASLGGTSMASPMAAGVAAMIWSQNPGWTASQVETQLYASAENIDKELSSQYIGKMGAGRINLHDAVNTGPPPPPVAEFSGSPTTGVVPLTVTFTDLSTGSIDTWSWTFGDGGTSSAQNPVYEYTTAGTYTVSLNVTGPGGSDGETKTNYITVNPCVSPTADFVGTPTTGCAPLAVDFTDQSTNAASWNWDFGDETGTSTQQNPSYTYTAAGCYTVTLNVTNACGSDGVTKVDYVCADPCGPDHAYANADLPVAGTVSGDFSNTIGSDNVYEGITEIEYANHPRKRSSYLEHKWTINVGGGGAAMMFYVEGHRPTNAEGDNFVFAYSTDDATYVDMVTIASATDQVYSYALPAGLTGTLYVRVVDTDRSWGNTAFDPVYVDEMYIEYSSQPGPPVADFVGNPTSGDEPLTVSFTDLSTGDPTSLSWDFGDGIGTSTAPNPTYEYANNGTYTVQLTATNAYGADTEIKVDYITVTVPGLDYAHVEDMAVGRTKSGPNTLGTCTVTIYDNNNLPLANATVYVTYDGPTSGSSNGVTAADGTVDFQTTGFKKPTGQWCFEVTNVAHGTHTYDPAANKVTRACEDGWVYADGQSAGLLGEHIPDHFALSQSYPNPFNPTTTVSFTLAEASQVELVVFNVIGQKVATLAHGYFQPGEHSVKWDARNNASGVYFYRIQAGTHVETRSMMLLK